MTTAQDDRHSSLRTEYLQVVDKRRYYLLGAGGAVLAFALTSIDSTGQNPAFLVLLASLFFLGSSAFCGLLAVEATRRFLDGSLWSLLLEAIDKEKFERGGGVLEFNKELIIPFIKRAERLDLFQLWLFVIAVFLLAIWKVTSCGDCVVQISNLIRLES